MNNNIPNPNTPNTSITSNNPNTPNTPTNQLQQKKDNVIPPNALNITINTSVPGFQKFKYKPNMTIPNISKDDNTVAFNPLVKLNKNVINQVPEQVRVKEFFNRGLFNSLVNLHGLQRERSLGEATYYGFVDNNIQVTLDTIFPPNGLIYINKKPYRIADIKWRKGDWRIATKNIDIPPLDSSKIRDPFLFQSVVEDEIISGEEQMANLPDNVVFGSTYNISEDPTAMGRPKTEAAIQQEKIEEETGPNIPPTTLALSAPEATTTFPELTAPEATTTFPALPAPEATTTFPALPPPEKLLALTEGEDATPQIEYPNYLPPPIPAIEGPPKVEEIEESNIPSPEVKLVPSIKSTQTVKEYFRNTNYYYMINQLFLKMNRPQQIIINKYFRDTTETNVKLHNINLSKRAYENSINGLSVSQNEGGGNCFFLTVADAINFNNYKHPNNKILYGIYGQQNKFTSASLRNIVANYVYSNYDKFIPISSIYISDLNNLFSNTLRALEDAQGGPLTQSQYMDILLTTYTESKNFLVKRPDNVPVGETEKFKPFSLLPKNEVKSYILSYAYQGDEVSITALSTELKLMVIPISEKKDGKFNIPYFDFFQRGWSRYLFLYHSELENHYELITFRQSLSTNKKRSTTWSIFDTREKGGAPVYIFYLMFATGYITLGDKEKPNVYFFPDIFETFNKSFNEIYSESIKSPKDNEIYNNSNNFLITFKKTFDLSNNFLSKYSHFNSLPKIKFKSRFTQKNKYIRTDKPVTRSTTKSISSTVENKVGGQPVQTLQRTSNPYQPIYQPIYRANLPPIEKVLKSEEDKSNLSYHIAIDMELRQGKEPLTPEEMSNLKCSQKWNSVRRSFAELTGQKYVIPPVYENLPVERKGNVETKKNNNKKGGRKTRKRI
jgi:hypothetical protein